MPCHALILGLSEVVRGSLAAAKPACQPPNLYDLMTQTTEYGRPGFHIMLFGGLLGQTLTRLFERFGRRGVQGLQAFAASGSILIGALLVGQSL